MTNTVPTYFFYLAVVNLIHTRQERMKRRNCRLNTKTPNYQLGRAVSAARRLLDKYPKTEFSGYEVKISQAIYTCYIKSMLYSIKAQSTIPPLLSSLIPGINVGSINSDSRSSLNAPWITIGENECSWQGLASFIILEGFHTKDQKGQKALLRPSMSRLSDWEPFYINQPSLVICLEFRNFISIYTLYIRPLKCWLL